MSYDDGSMGLKLDVKLYGRDSELQHLHFAFEKVVTEDESMMVLIEGYAGTGKSRLVSAFRDDLKKNHPEAYFVTGKFDERQTDPFSSLADALSELSRLLIQNEPPDQLKLIKHKIIDAIGSEGQVLTSAIPALDQILGTQPDMKKVSMPSSRNRLKYHFQCFFQAICSKNRPIILFLDDLQWSDASSLDLMVSLMTDSKLKQFLFIGAYRDNEVESFHPLADRLELLREKGTSFVSIHIGNLDKSTLREYIAEALRLEPEEVQSLTDTLFVKTRGNVFHTRAALLLLEQAGILKYSLVSYRWEWDLERLRMEMRATENVVDLSLQSLESLPSELKSALMTASFLRSSFDVETLYCLLLDSPAEESKHYVSLEELAKLLETAVMGGWLEFLPESQKYRFVHDRVREAAQSLPDDSTMEQKQRLVSRIGRKLIELASKPSGQPWMFFAGVNNLNSIDTEKAPTMSKTLELVDLNYEAGRRAVARSAYAPAAGYLQRALRSIEVLPSRWETHYDLCLDLYCRASDVDFCIGQSDRAYQSANEVLSHARTERDKLSAYIVLAEGLGISERHSEALELDRKSLQVVANFPRRFQMFHVFRDISSIKSLLRKKTEEEILGLSLMTESDKLVAMKILQSMWVRAYLCNEMVTSLLCMTRAMRMTFEYGLSPQGACAFAAYGMLLCGPLGDHEMGIRLGRLSHRILQLTDGKDNAARVLFTTAVHIDAWVLPLSTVQKNLFEGYESGMLTGDTEFAFFSLAYFNVHSFMMGLPLEPIIKESKTLIQQMEQYEVASVRAIVLPFHQLLVDLSGSTTDPLAWIHAAESQRRAHDPSENVKVIWSYLSRGQLAYYLGEHEVAHRIWKLLRPLLVGMASYSAPTLDIYFAGLIATAMFRKKGERKYRREAQKALEGMNSLIKKFNTGLNNLHRFYLMQADCAATLDARKNRDDVRKQFDKAIAAATKAGFMQDAALANELCGEYFLKREDLFWGKHYLTSAFLLYKEWGALAKVDKLLENRGSFIDKEVSNNRASMASSRKGPLTARSSEMSLFSCVEFDHAGESGEQRLCGQSLCSTG